MNGLHKNLLLARSNVRKARGQTVAIVVLVLLASIMMNLWLMLGTDYRKNFDRTHDRLHDGHVTLLAYRQDDEFADFTENLLENRSDVTEYCITNVYGFPGSFEYNGGEMISQLAFIDKETALSRSVGKVEMIENSGDSSLTSGIYLPTLYSTSYSVGDDVELIVGTEKLKYTVCGFFNSVMAGSHNCAICEMVLTEDKYEELSTLGTIPKATFVSVRVTDKTDTEAIEASIKDAVTGEFPELNFITNSYAMASTSRYISQSICAAVLSVMALLITLIAVVVISSNVMNYIQEDMQNLGALKAIGYKSGQLVSALITQFVSVALITSAVGIALSYAIFPALNEMMIAQTGIPYEMRFLPVPCAATLIFMVGVIAAAVFLSARRIRKIEPITALRRGIQTHSFKRNHVPLDKTKSPLSFALAMKTLLSGKKQNVTIGVTMIVLSLVLVFGVMSFENITFSQHRFIDLVMGESCDSAISIHSSAVEKLKSALENDSRTEKYYLFTDDYVTHSNVSLMATICDDCASFNNQSYVIEGRFPKYDNEVAIAIKYAREQGLRVGDEITLAAGGNEGKFIISGYTQLANNLGKDCLITLEGFSRLNVLSEYTYYINVKDGTDINAFNEDITKSFSDEVNATTNAAATIEGSASVYISLMTVIIIALMILSAVIVMFVLYLLVRTMLNNKKRDYGIYKSLGFTTGQLVLQTALSFMPTIIISTAVGVTVSAFVINPLMALMLGGIGIVKCTFDVPLGFVAAAGVGLVLFAFGMACLLSLRVKRISPIEMLAGD